MQYSLISNVIQRNNNLRNITMEVLMHTQYYEANLISYHRRKCYQIIANLSIKSLLITGLVQWMLLYYIVIASYTCVRVCLFYAHN